ncbi:MAG: hypothetical protein ABIJ56_09525, partial [Pseudomonadota bacterium]
EIYIIERRGSIEPFCQIASLDHFSPQESSNELIAFDPGKSTGVSEIVGAGPVAGVRLERVAR